MIAILLIGFDFLFASLADKRIRDADFFFETHLGEIELGPEYGKHSFYRFDQTFLIYVYKTCFIRRTGQNYNEWLYTFHYARPYPILLGGRNRNSYRFNECGGGSPRKQIKYDGTIIKEMGS